MKKIIFLVLLVLLASTVLYSYRYSLTNSKVYINHKNLNDFANITPLSSTICEQQHSLEYYFYEDDENFKTVNNKFGLYIYPDNEKFIELADQLVNSNGGDWGYVLIPYNLQDDHNEKWERVFYLLNKRHLIPIVQLWNIDPKNYEEETKEAVEFLDSFVWPIKDRYISVYNEPNDAAFWYGYVDPAEYARILNYTIDTFKEVNEDFFIINGALNVSASDTATSMDAFEYLILMQKEVPGIFEKLDGWASHSYPQPNFSGDPMDVGRRSIRAYEEELKFLENNFGVSNLPVFITETGWAHDIGKEFDPSYLSMSSVAENFRTAYEEVWLKDDRVRAVTPFTIWYEPPYDHFSWVDSRLMPYEHFQLLKSLKKVSGLPPKLVISSVETLGCGKD